MINGVTSTYGEVDRSEDPEHAADWQERVDAWPAIQAYKRHTYELLRGQSSVLDIGCGPGEDAAAIGAERTVALDRSWVMCRRAGARVGRVCQAIAERLPFADSSFGACRADRVVQHLDNPMRALEEMVRVTRSGGRVVIADPDQETLVIQIPGVRAELADAAKTLRRDVGYRNGRVATRLPALLATMGLVDISIAAFPLVLTDPDDAFGLPRWPRLWQELGRFDDGDIAEWDEGIGRAGEHGMIHALLYFVVAATTR